MSGPEFQPTLGPTLGMEPLLKTDGREEHRKVEERKRKSGVLSQNALVITVSASTLNLSLQRHFQTAINTIYRIEKISKHNGEAESTHTIA